MSIGALPTSLEVDGVEYPIRTHFKNVLLIYDAYLNPNLTDFEKQAICLKILYKDNIPLNAQCALEKAMWFLDNGDAPKPKQSPVKMMDWKQDESMIFSAVNKVAGCETRLQPYIHWWTFLGYFQEIPEKSMYAQVLRIRKLKAEGGKEMTKEDRKFFNSHKAIIELQDNTVEDDEEKAFINSLI